MRASRDVPGKRKQKIYKKQKWQKIHVNIEASYCSEGILKMAEEVRTAIQRQTASLLTNIIVGTICFSLTVSSYICFYRWFIIQSGWDDLNPFQKRLCACVRACVC